MRGDVTETLNWLNNLLNEDLNGQHLMVSDFNLHHPTWGGVKIERDREMKQLLIIMNERQLSLLLPQGSITWRAGESQSIIDLTIDTSSVMQRLESCSVREESYDSDHLSILTTLLLNALKATPIMCRQ